MMKKELLEKLTGEFGKSFMVPVEWVKENDQEVYEHLLDKAENRILHDDWIVEYTFNNIDGEIEIIITAGEDRQMLNNQPAWIQETITLDVFIEVYEYEKYLEQLMAGQSNLGK